MRMHYLPFHIDDVIEIVLAAALLDVPVWLWLHYHNTKRIVTRRAHYVHVPYTTKQARVIRAYVPSRERASAGLDEG